MAQHEQRKGAWIIRIGDTIIVENSEIRALRTAVADNGTVEFVEWGHAVGGQPSVEPSSLPGTDSY